MQSKQKANKQKNEQNKLTEERWYHMRKTTAKSDFIGYWKNGQLQIEYVLTPS